MSIWSITGHFNETASRLPKVKERLSQVDKHEDMITAEKVKTAIRKILKDPKGSFKGIFFHLRFFVVVLIPLLIILNETDLEYVAS